MIDSSYKLYYYSCIHPYILLIQSYGILISKKITGQNPNTGCVDCEAYVYKQYLINIEGIVDVDGYGMGMGLMGMVEGSLNIGGRPH